ncbi:MAG: hypothetical protein WC728_06115 [Elusimicrobiota bacterium]
MLTALLGDTFFYASGGGLLVSAIAFPFILKRFRAAPASSVSPDIPMDLREPPAFVEPVEPVRVVEAEPEEAPPKPAEKVADVEIPAETPVKTPPPQVVPEPKKINPSITLTSGLSPAIVYLQNLKIQIEHFEKEIHQLRGQILDYAKKHDDQFGDIVKRMGSMQAEIHQQMHAPEASPEAAQHSGSSAPAVHAQVEHPVSQAVAAASVSAPAPEPAPAPQASPEPAIVMQEDAPQLAQVPSVQIEETTALPPAPAAAPAPQAVSVAIENTVALPAAQVVPIAEPTMPIQITPEDVKPAPAPAREAAEDIAQSLSLSVPGQPAAESAEGEDDILKPRAKGPVWPV